jgi:hypothetical protein
MSSLTRTASRLQSSATSASYNGGRGDIACEVDAMGEADGKGLERQAPAGWDELALHGVPAFAVEGFAGQQGALRDGYDIAAPLAGGAGRLLP